MLTQDFLIVVRTILATPVRMVNAVFGRPAQSNGHVQRPDCQVPFHSVADGPADDTPGIKVQNHGQIEPALAGPDIANIDNLSADRGLPAIPERPFLIGAILSTPIQK